MTGYWEDRFAHEGMIWGGAASPTASLAAGLFHSAGVRSVLVPGAGYGRNTKALSGAFDVTGIELSGSAVRLGQQWDPKTRFVCGSALDPAVIPDNRYDAVYCYDLLHLFLAPERRELAEVCLERTRPGGLLFFTAFSDRDPNNGRGRCLEPGTYEYKPDKFAHFFSEQELAGYWGESPLVAQGELLETLNAGEKDEHQYILRYAAVRKPERPIR